jgi:CheY-like chemotaxis protein
VSEKAEILLVEDNDVNQLVAVKYLGRLNLKADVASNGMEAIQLAEKTNYQVVLMDLQMPRMNGYEATAALRQLSPHYAKTPIIALTAATYSEIAEKIKIAGLTDYITKPFTPEDLKNILGKYLPLHSEVASEIVFESVKRQVEELASGDADFRQQLVTLFLQSLKELHEIYGAALSSGDLEQLKLIRHKHKANLDLLSLTVLSGLIDQGKSMLESGKASIEERRILLNELDNYFQRITAILQALLD